MLFKIVILKRVIKFMFVGMEIYFFIVNNVISLLVIVKGIFKRMSKVKGMFLKVKKRMKKIVKMFKGIMVESFLLVCCWFLNCFL